ncbi:translation initiation factor IF-2-like isoform X2 [Drosophila innubila]|uniref:translation initiation factor IF-2-like isoform X2 n=1 Tax=Drosophila innubila TaxID=198719 RepID=UPI00148D7312|nr:translation initiation factor IF-2-like isoform X2 [Drosophila innubila]
MIMAYARLAMACPRIGYRIEQHGLLQPQRKLVQVKLPLLSSSARPFLQTARKLCKDSDKPKDCSEDKPDNSTECSADKENQPKECSKDNENKPKECSEKQEKELKECSEDKGDKCKESAEDKKDNPEECSADNENKPENKENQSNECSEDKENKPKECSEDIEDKPKECSDDDDDTLKECPGAPKMPCCEDSKSVCVDPCEEDEEMEQIAAHVGGRCAKHPCAKVRDPCEMFIKQHIGSPIKPKDTNQQQPMAKSETIK